MTLRDPFKISPRLLPGLFIGGAWVSLEHVGNAGDRMVYRWYIDLPDGQEHSEADLKSGCQGADLQSMFCTLLAFLGACAESRGYSARTGREGENSDLFPEEVGAWAEEHSDEIDMIRCDIEERGVELIEG